MNTWLKEDFWFWRHAECSSHWNLPTLSSCPSPKFSEKPWSCGSSPLVPGPKLRTRLSVSQYLGCFSEFSVMYTFKPTTCLCILEKLGGAGRRVSDHSDNMFSRWIQRMQRELKETNSHPALFSLWIMKDAPSSTFTSHESPEYLSIALLSLVTYFWTEICSLTLLFTESLGQISLLGPFYWHVVKKNMAFLFTTVTLAIALPSFL